MEHSTSDAECRIVVVGASLAGLRSAESLRKAGWRGEIVIVGAEPYLPYNRPPLSKAVLYGDRLDTSEAVVASTAFKIREDLDATWLLGQPVISADLERRHVMLDDGRQITFDGLVVATGLRPRRLPFTGAEFRHTVRTLDDALNLRASLTPGRRVVLIGGGFIGCEIAASAQRLGCSVTVVESSAEPMAAALGPDVARALRRHHERHGAGFRRAAQVEAIDSRADCDHTITLTTGEILRADVVVEAVGSTPNVDWLEGNGLDLTDGVLCDQHMRVEGRSHVVAVGDVARFPLPRFRTSTRRVEHWAVPVETAKVAAAALSCGVAAERIRTPLPDIIPSFWSDQFGLRLTAFGTLSEGDRSLCLEGDLAALEGRPVESTVLGYFRDERLVGVLGINAPGPLLAQYRPQLGCSVVHAR